jgi:hypothetical protein
VRRLPFAQRFLLTSPQYFVLSGLKTDVRRSELTHCAFDTPAQLGLLSDGSIWGYCVAVCMCGAPVPVRVESRSDISQHRLCRQVRGLRRCRQNDRLHPPGKLRRRLSHELQGVRTPLKLRSLHPER